MGIINKLYCIVLYQQQVLETSRSYIPNGYTIRQMIGPYEEGKTLEREIFEYFALQIMDLW